MQAREVRSVGLAFGRIGIWTVDQHDVAQQRRIDARDFEIIQGQSQKIQFGLRVGEQHGARRRGALPSGAGAFAADERVHECAFASPRPTECGDDQGGFEPDAESFHAAQEPTHESPAMQERLPVGLRLGPVGEPVDQLVDLRQHFQLRQFGGGHRQDFGSALGIECFETLEKSSLP